MKIIIYISNFNKIGGVETFVRNFYKRMVNVTVLYDNGTTGVGEKIDWKKKYDCDIFISASAWGKTAFDNINAKAYVQMVHADYRVIIEGWAFKYQKHPLTTHHVCVGETAKIGFEQTTPYKSDAVIYNLLDNTIKQDKKPKNKVLTLITCSRLSGEKGFKRMLQMAKQLDEQGVKYIWNVWGDTSSSYAKGLIDGFKDYPNVFFKGITSEPHKEINKADYLVQLSDTEGFAYSVYEAMQVKTPCIITPFVSGKEQITHGINGYIVPFDMNGIDYSLIQKRSLKVPKLEELGKEDHWIKFFDSCLKWHEDNMMMVRITSVVQKYKIGEVVSISKERALSGIERGLCELVE